MIIGNFSGNEARDTFAGEPAPLTVATRKVVLRPIEAKTDKAPNHCVVSPDKAGDVGLGAGWSRATNLMIHTYLVARQPQGRPSKNPARAAARAIPFAIITYNNSK